MPPASLPAWRAKLEKAGLGLESQTDLSARLYQRPRWGLTALLHALRMAHVWAKSAGQRIWERTLSRLEPKWRPRPSGAVETSPFIE